MRSVLTLISSGRPITDSGQPETFDTIIRGGTVYDGSGSPGVRADVGLRGHHRRGA